MDPAPRRDGRLRSARDDFERRHIAEVLEREGQVVSRAAAVLGLTRQGPHKKSKSLPYSILATAETEAHVRGEFSFTSVGDVQLRGRSAPTVVFGLPAGECP